MEEADVLCNRIGIVNNGVMTCLGSQNRLKTLYGGGYHLTVNCQMSGNAEVDRKRFSNLTNFISEILPFSIKLRMFNGQFVYQVPIEGFKAQELFVKIEKYK